MAQKFKFISIDLDGTLLTKTKKIAKSSYQVLDQFYDQNPGCIGAIITGRYYRSAKRYCDAINRTTKKFKISYLGCGNGSLFYKINNDGVYQLIQKALIPSKQAKKVYELCQKREVLFWGCPENLYKGAPIVLSNHFIGKCIRLTRWNDVHLTKTYVNENYSKINVIASTKKELDEFLIEINSLYPNTFQIIRTSPMMFEITGDGVNKGAIVDLICQAQNIPFDQRVAIGDSNNDLKMFEKVGTKVAVNDASNLLKDMATHIGTKRGSKRFSCVFNEFLLN